MMRKGNHEKTSKIGIQRRKGDFMSFQWIYIQPNNDNYDFNQQVDFNRISLISPRNKCVRDLRDEHGNTWGIKPTIVQIH
jgi:hypothetical protein